MWDLSFSVRLVVLGVVMLAVAGVDYGVKRERATKWREYAFLCVAGLVGGLFGMAVDQITGRISPEYFEFGKGISPGPGYWSSVMALGFRAGFFGGLLVGVAALMANNPRPELERLSWRRLGGLLWWPMAAAALGAAGCGVVGAMDVFGLKSGLDAAEIIQGGRLLAVQGAHFGLYLGGLLGVVLVVRRVRRMRRELGAVRIS
ncbi:hypothetical protein [Sulfuriroseicoccus oceanibius]|uniref:Uncharacterized protein n=1 Tax=Sulfuriroseicoccus oceanibius TaxID=2707525 RepID=A0A6B3LFC2_9BACT|nr:hypothetical protein [Sulfuriroseicoccus oceanibius]QQL45898.1 hypothetical protein G3M56_004770 [Sulfuriroseicoccus oceanibius]